PSPPRVRRPAAPAAPPAAASGQVAVTGDAEVVVLVSAAGRFPPGEIPAGSYTVEARFPGRGQVQAGRVQVAAGASVKLNCDSGFALCRETP
ncbi:MAG: hypothetical protein ABIO70_18990, partial [Pseudomonadota bacterium]